MVLLSLTNALQLATTVSFQILIYSPPKIMSSSHLMLHTLCKWKTYLTT